VASFEAPPEALILDFDATDDRVHGAQVGGFYHGYYGDYCFLPLYVFCGEQLLVSYLRPSNRDGARHASRGAGVVGQSVAPTVARRPDPVAGS
jgi:hypothetical protein